MIYICYLLIIVGLFLSISTLVGLMRIGDSYQMLHIAAVSDVAGVPLFLLGLSGLCFLDSQNALGFKILLLILLMYITVPIAGYILIKAMYLLRNPKDSDIA